MFSNRVGLTRCAWRSAPGQLLKKQRSASLLPVLVSAVCSVVLVAIMPAKTLAEYYKWQDAQGNWHMSDEPPPASGAERPLKTVERFGKPTPNISSGSNSGGNSGSDGPFDRPANNTRQSGSSSSGSEVGGSSDGQVASESVNDTADGWSPTGENLAERLTKKYPDEAPIARTTLSVVTIETVLGNGSGFFVTNAGHIVTNKHVVRPASSRGIQQAKLELDERKNVLRGMGQAIQKERRKLRRLKKDLDEHAKYVKSKPDGSSSKKLAQREHEDFLQRYKQREREFQTQQRQYREANKEINSLSNDLNFKISMSNVARRFKVYLKDDTQIWAELVSVSEKHDLALLKVTNNETPYLNAAGKDYMSQGMSVFAIGSPMGLRDSVTKGIITGKQNGLIMTDTQILPGNSGGPLVTESGEVVGVNTFKLAEEANRQGFGLAIPIGVVFETFRDELPSLGVLGR